MGPMGEVYMQLEVLEPKFVQDIDPCKVQGRGELTFGSHILRGNYLPAYITLC